MNKEEDNIKKELEQEAEDNDGWVVVNQMDKDADEKLKHLTF